MFVYKDTIRFVGFIADLCAPELHTYVRRNTVYLQYACVRETVCVSDCVGECVFVPDAVRAG